MNKEKKLLMFILVLSLVLVSVFADRSGTNTLYVAAQVPENYGVSFPDDALRFGDFVFEVKFDVETEIKVDEKDGRALIREDTISVGEIVPGFKSFDFTLVYYGNLSKPYRSEINVDPNIVWVLKDQNRVATVPIKILLKKNIACDNDITCTSLKEGQAYIEIPPAGPREGVPILDVEISWEGLRDLFPGLYSTELKLDMRVL